MNKKILILLIMIIAVVSTASFIVYLSVHVKVEKMQGNEMQFDYSDNSKEYEIEDGNIRIKDVDIRKISGRTNLIVVVENKSKKEIDLTNKYLIEVCDKEGNPILNINGSAFGLIKPNEIGEARIVLGVDKKYIGDVKLKKL